MSGRRAIPLGKNEHSIPIKPQHAYDARKALALGAALIEHVATMENEGTTPHVDLDQRTVDGIPVEDFTGWLIDDAWRFTGQAKLVYPRDPTNPAKIRPDVLTDLLAIFFCAEHSGLWKELLDRGGTSKRALSRFYIVQMVDYWLKGISEKGGFTDVRLATSVGTIAF